MTREGQRNTDSERTGSDSKRSRRTILKSVGGTSALAFTGMAGCLGNQGGDDGDGGNGGDGGDSGDTGTSGGSGSAEDITIGISMPRSGSYSSVSTQLEFAYKGFQDWVNNDQGGIESDDGTHKLKLLINDDQSTESRARKLATRYANNDDVALIMISYGSPLVRAAAPVAVQQKKPLLSSASANTPLHEEYEYTFQTSRTITRFGEASLLEGNVSKAAVWGVDLGWTKQSMDSFVERAPDHNVEVVLHQAHSRDQRDFSSLIRKAQSEGAEAVITAGYPEHAVAVASDISGSNWRPKFASFQSFGDIGSAEQVGQQTANRIGFPSIWDSSIESESNQVMKRKFDELAPSGESPSYHTALAWGSMENVAGAIRALGNDVYDGQALNDWFIETDPLETVLGPAEWNEKGGQAGVEWNLGQWQMNDGELTRPYVYPDEFKQAEFQFPKQQW